MQWVSRPALLLLFLCGLLLTVVACAEADPEPDPPVAPTAEQQPTDEPEPDPAESREQSASPDAGTPNRTASSSRQLGLPVVANDPDRFDWLDYQTTPNGPYGFRTALAVFAETNNTEFDMMGLEYICDAGIGLWVLAAAYPSYDGERRNIAAPLNLDLGFAASAVFDSSTSSQDHYLEFNFLDNTSAQHSDGVFFMATSKAYEQVLIRLPYGDNYISAVFDLRGVFNTPIQPNLDRCGDY